MQHNDANFGIGTLAALIHIWVVIARLDPAIHPLLQVALAKSVAPGSSPGGAPRDLGAQVRVAPDRDWRSSRVAPIASATRPLPLAGGGPDRGANVRWCEPFPLPNPPPQAGADFRREHGRASTDSRALHHLQCTGKGARKKPVNLIAELLLRRCGARDTLGNIFTVH